MPKIKLREGVGEGEGFIEPLSGVFHGEVFIRFVERYDWSKELLKLSSFRSSEGVITEVRRRLKGFSFTFNDDFAGLGRREKLDAINNAILSELNYFRRDPVIVDLLHQFRAKIAFCLFLTEMENLEGEEFQAAFKFCKEAFTAKYDVREFNYYWFLLLKKRGVQDDFEVHFSKLGSMLRFELNGRQVFEVSE
ncbi:hypothetical protein KA119_02595 [Candidatus Gracilibacteria bacterium]|nr:hypothetical protein [Candidatus Gracilibacteria bacterium]